ncbi:hypothetical protein [Blastomonas sp. UPD001]|uniref:hypothetical protein n=1 Tax=Blastomonas sp. UPD001 TaxID=2217673 RepID=UPI000E3442BF|nr:hypothetical protein [Blastomonas sp. UPD001]
MTHEELAARIERAEGPDRALDCLVHEVIGNVVDHVYAEMHSAEETPFYTASIDAAMQLVPPDREWSIEGYTCSGVRPDHVRASAWVLGSPRVFAATPAIALCAAAIRARSAS